MIFNSVEEVVEHLLVSYPKSKGKTLMRLSVSDYATGIAIYEGEDLIQGIIIYFDPHRFQWVLLDSLPADLAVRNYIEFRAEFVEAIELFELLESIDEDEENEDEELFFTDLD